VTFTNLIVEVSFFESRGCLREEAFPCYADAESVSFYTEISEPVQLCTYGRAAGP